MQGRVEGPESEMRWAPKRIGTEDGGLSKKLKSVTYRAGLANVTVFGRGEEEAYTEMVAELTRVYQ